MFHTKPATQTLQLGRVKNNLPSKGCLKRTSPRPTSRVPQHPAVGWSRRRHEIRDEAAAAEDEETERVGYFFFDRDLGLAGAASVAAATSSPVAPG